MDKSKKFGHPRFYDLVEEIREIHSKKNHDYAGLIDPLSNFKACQRIGVRPIIGCWTRIQDKISRIEHILSGEEPLNESLEDSLKDLAVYSLIAIILADEERGKK